MKKIISFLLLFAFGLSSCEKDDICDANTPTTPRLIITFYDKNNPTVRKKPKNLTVIGLNQPKGIIFNESAPLEEDKYLANTDSIAVPLRTNAETTTYDFTLNSGDENPLLINTDRIQFDYTHQEIYVSRACGFKSIFQALTLLRTDPNADGLWMNEIFIVTPNNNIENENEAHIKIFF
jgi:hypothetical protein